MKQVLQRVRGGATDSLEVPTPTCGPHDVLVLNEFSVVSPGTERKVVQLAQSSLLYKAKARPDEVARVLRRARTHGWRRTWREVQERLGEAIPLGYSTAGRVVAVGARIQDLSVGQSVATVGAHAHISRVGRLGVAPVPEGLPVRVAASAGVVTVALEAMRVAPLQLGARALVVGLGFVGQSLVRLLGAQGVSVAGVDPKEGRVALAMEAGMREGALRIESPGGLEGSAFDAVFLTADRIDDALLVAVCGLARAGARVVVVGDMQGAVPRDDFFRKGLELRVSSSLGPGRWEPDYEERGIDYPVERVRWTLERNLRAALDTMGAPNWNSLWGALEGPVSVEDAASAYERLTQHGALGFSLAYDASGLGLEPEDDTQSKNGQPKRDQPSCDVPRSSLEIATTITRRASSVGVVGAGRLARMVTLPWLRDAGGFARRGVVSRQGASAAIAAKDYGFEGAYTSVDELFEHSDAGALFVLSRHDSHADYVAYALQQGAHSFVEKPLCLTVEELSRIDQLKRQSDRVVAVGHNRRFAPAVVRLRERAGLAASAITIRFLVAGNVGETWSATPEQGGVWLSEGGHCLDLATYVLRSPIAEVHAIRHGGDDRVMVHCRHESGALSSVVLSSAGDSTGAKERIEVLSGHKSLFLDDYRTLEVHSGGSAERTRFGGDKGHRACLDSFRGAVLGESSWPVPWDETYRIAWATLAAKSSLHDGEVHRWS